MRGRAALAAALFATACAGDGSRTAKPARVCAASSDAVDAYLSRIAGIASNGSRGDVLGRHESGTVSFALAPDGSVSELRVERATRPAVGEEVLRAVAAGAPYPRPPFDPAACLVSGRAEIGLIGHMRCDETRQHAYIDAIAQRIREAVGLAGITAEEPERVMLRFKVDRHGTPDVRVQDAPSVESGERIAAVARTLAPFEPPGDAIAECVSDAPFFISIDLPGTTRPAVRIQ